MKLPPHVQHLFLAQHGVAHVAQLLEADIHRSTLWRWKARHEIIEVLPGVYHLPSSPAGLRLRAMAAQLQAAPDGFLSGFTAAKLRGIWELPELPIRTTVPRRPPGVRVLGQQRTPLPGWIDRSESNWHDHDDVELVDGFRLERPESMLFTIAAHCNDYRFERIAEKAWNTRLTTPSALLEYVVSHRRSGRSGVARTLRWLVRVGERTRAMQSNFETDLLHAIRRVGLPEPAKQLPLRLLNGEIIHFDLAWPRLRLAIEPGHSRFHGGDRLSEERDAARDRASNALGWMVVRYSEEQRADLAAVAREIAAIYRSRTTAV